MLKPISELDFYPNVHRYRWRGDWVLHNVSEVLSFDMSPFKRKMIDKYKDGEDGWQARGNAVHAALDAFLRDEPHIHNDRWSPWIDALLDDSVFQGIETMATEYRLVDRFASVAGSTDFLIRFADDPSFVMLGDLKTVSSAKAVSGREPALAQLGAYTKMLQQHHPKICVTECVTVVSGPDKVKVRRHSPQDECLPAWDYAWGKFEAAHSQFDF